MSDNERAFVHPAITAVFGLVFVACAIWIVSHFGSELDWKAGIGAFVIGALGLEALFSAARRRRSWLERIGPLP